MYKTKAEAKDLMSHGVSACTGCDPELVFRNVIRALGEDTIAIIPSRCVALFSRAGNTTNMKIAGHQCNLENTAASAVGVRAGLNTQGNEHTTVLTFTGGDVTTDIGLQSLPGVTKHGNQILYVCCGNEVYMNAGIQGSSATPYGANTTTTPARELICRKGLLKIAITHHILCVASCSVTNLPDLVRKVEKTKDVDGPPLPHVYTPCPTDRVFPLAKSVEVCRITIETGAWVLYEYEEGWITVNKKAKELRPIGNYLSPQGRSKSMTKADMKILQRETAARYEELLASEG